MSNKFLPFVTKNSSPLHMYTSLISKSKGHNWSDILTVLVACSTLGVDSVKQHVRGLPDMTKDELFKNLVNTYSSYRPSEELTGIVRCIERYLKESDLLPTDGEFSDMDADEIIFYYVFCYLAKLHQDPAYFNFSFIFSNHSDILKNIPDYVLFSSRGGVLLHLSEVGYKDDLKGFILFQAGLSDDNESKRNTYTVILSKVT